MKENPKINRSRMPRAPERKHRRENALFGKKPREASKAPKIPDDVIDEMLAELREAENVAHE